MHNLPPLKLIHGDTLSISFKGYDLSGDKDWQTLKTLAEKVRFSQDKKLKRQLWEQERLVLEQELANPEKYLERVKITGGMDDVPETHEAQLNQVRINALKGLITYYIPLRDMELERFTDPKFYYPQFENILKDISNNAPLAEDLKTWALHLSSAMYDDLDRVHKNKAEELALHIIKTSPHEQCKTIALNLFADHVDKSNHSVKDVQEIFLKKWENSNPTEPERNLSLIALGKLNTPELNNILPELLSSNSAEVDNTLKTIAAWCAGRVKSDNNYELLMRTLKSALKQDPDLKDENNLRLAEMALASIVEYNETKPQEVSSVLQALTKKNSSLSINANALKDKLEGKCKIPEFYLAREIESLKEQEEFKTLRSRYVEGMNLLDEEQMNWLDRGLLPFRKFLDFFNSVKAKLIISEDTATGTDTKLTGKRTGDGRFWDLVTGIAGDNQAIVTTCDFKKPFKSKAHISGHEMAHQVLKYLMKFDIDEYNELKRLFEKAKKDNKCLDAYSASDIEEFWAVGYETYLLHYKPHASLIDFAEKEVGTANTRSVLKRRDPEFYDFIEHIIKKYGLSEVGVKRAKDAYKNNRNRVIKIEIKVG